MKNYRLLSALGAALFIIGALGIVLTLIALLAAVVSRDPVGANKCTTQRALILLPR